MITVMFNGVKITDYMIVTNLDRGIGTERENKLQKIGTSRGQKLMSTTCNEKVIEMDFRLRYNLISKRRELAKALDVNEPKELIFSDEPNIKYYAIPTGDISVSENNFIGTGTIQWLIPEGLGYGIVRKTVSNNGESPSVTLVNEGTADAFVDIDCDIKSDNGGLAFIANNRAFQVGDFGELDGVNKQHSDGVIWSPMTANNLSNMWTDKNVILGNTSVPIMGTLTTQGTGEFGSRTMVSNYGDSGSQVIYHGPARMATLASGGGKNISTTLMLRLYCPDRNVYTGFLQFCLIATDGSVVAHIEFAIANPQAQQGLWHVYVNGQKRWTVTAPFNSNYGYVGNGAPYINFNKEGDTIILVIGGNTLYFKNPAIKDKIINRFSFQQAKWMTNAAAVNEVWIVAGYKNYTTWNDIPNSMKRGDKVKIDSSSYEATINGNPLRIAQGSKPLVIPPGTTQLSLVKSDFATMPEFTATIREVFI